ncbi:nitrogen regulation protein NR(II) [Cocleimonas sp. KMM 6892]|uniref:nitrogen regulation protein NR(II) n=1 Tax=unclassified Cocleimonas TaxID=2639732 RepID=UPI002DBACF48|nr:MULTISPECIES: nitrogen regulation protein NR(II) [unclassified Cocleimonas]MEB8431407.1 nitrogen regulation protein NR(II) [Cocleimonas sp. KMM 6892]MEC4713821.1 nitrogen regulation protein NR(II) [Cocleimonas sp. KMM 6895]MEC4743152.1 nitrogen regulation protein NR(II) [Cocleimonas sp. KMM 6896]
MAKDIQTQFSPNEISDTISIAIIVLDESLRVRQMNAAAENLFGQSRERIIDKPFSVILHEDIMRDHLDFVIENEEPQAVRGRYLKGQQKKDIIVDCVATPFIKNSKLKGIVLELYRTDFQLRIAREEQLLSQQEATQSLVRGMAHEIKNPLGGLRGAAQLLDSELDSEELKEYTRIIISEADRLQKLVDRLLGSRQPTKNQWINIHEVLERVRRLVKADIPKGVNLQFDYDPSIPELQADLDNLIQIVFNIVGNALKAVGDSGNILFRTRILRNYVINNKQYRLALKLEVIDDGGGVPENIRNKLFFPMISGSANGTGLGLSIAQSLANRHHGVIEFTSEPGETCFTLLLPIDNSKAD